MASKKKSKESKKRRWPSPPGSGGGAVSLPESTRSKLWELFGQIEHEFELIHSENTACEFIQVAGFLVLEDGLGLALAGGGERTRELAEE